ncbi:patatin-like phospholipase family protein [Stigmatella aurantiaca]|uniref:Patatin-like phospholipase family protein n=1 Tax=Stigmatella aurantiaca (strain DW4/3-1) TaxID=378806 RepID=Q091B8_STIAD|nr:patatin-like phospholipase family protein [Stigmatella aurantiaca]ADO72612.1 Patatin-like phospholipase family protein [Stigmatella aurantiaca DW4/3-1]EAU66327.1 phospholipase, patatin family [Stigmatella aurantiaca DW4/3-1]CAQ34922.1 TPA: putative phospholipase, patatin-like [Stigmatella aurantiaca DW4/3-1]
MPFRILAMDGSSVSGGEGYVTAGMIRTLRQMLDASDDRRTLLNNVDLFTGSSAGAFNAAFLASEENPDAALSKILDFWGEVVAMNRKAVSLGRSLVALTGASSLLDSSYMRDFFCSYFGATLKLGDLKRKVAIPSFQLDGRRKGLRTWKAKIFHNSTNPSDSDMDELVVDVLMRSGSPPLSYPIYQGMAEQGSGYVDGGLFANNPSLVGLAQAINNLSRKDGRAVETMESEQPDLTNILLLSFGNGCSSTYLTPHFCNGTANWGFSKWLLDIRDPMVLVKMLLEAGSDAVHYQCRMILRKEYFRLNPVVDDRLEAYDLQQVEAALKKLLATQSSIDQLAHARRWLLKSGWMGDAAPAVPPAPDGA